MFKKHSRINGIEQKKKIIFLEWLIFNKTIYYILFFKFTLHLKKKYKR